MKNTALILTGHLRDWKTAYPSIKKNFIDPYNADVFISSWSDYGYWVSPDKDPNNKGVNEASPFVSYKDIYDLPEIYNPISYDLLAYKRYESAFTKRAQQYLPFCNEIRPVNVVSQFYQIHKGISMMEDYVAETGKQYDIVIRTRPDVVWEGEFPDFNVANFYQNFYTSYHRNHTGQGTGDMLQVSDFEGMVRFKEIIYYFDMLTKNLNRFCPHMFVERYVKESLDYKIIELNVAKTLSHTPNGQYINYERETNA